MTLWVRKLNASRLMTRKTRLDFMVLLGEDYFCQNSFLATVAGRAASNFGHRLRKSILYWIPKRFYSRSTFSARGETIIASVRGSACQSPGKLTILPEKGGEDENIFRLV